MKLKHILTLFLSILVIAIAINAVNAAEIDNSSNDVISSSNVDTSDGLTHTYKAKGSSVYVKDYNPKYKLSLKAQKQFKNVKKAPKKIYKISIDDDMYKSLKNAKKTKKYASYTINTNYKCKVLKPVLKSKTIKKTIINKKYTDRQKYFNDYSKYFVKYNTGKYNMDVKFHFYQGTRNIKYVTIKVTKKVKQVTVTKFKTGYTNVKALIGYAPRDGAVGKGSYLLIYGNALGYEFANYVANKHNFI